MTQAATAIHTVQVQGTALCFTCREDESILQGMRRAGCGPIHYGCHGGGCGVCKMRVVSGRVATFKAMSRAHVTEAEEAADLRLICCIQPRGSILLARVEA